MASCAANLSHEMSRQGSHYSSTSYQPVIGSISYNRASRSSVTNTNGAATSIIKSINGGSMNISKVNNNTNNRTRPTSRFSQASPERPIKVTTQRRQPSQDRSVSLFLFLLNNKIFVFI